MRTIFIISGLIILAGGGVLWRSLRMPSQFGEFTGAPKVGILEVIGKPEDFQHRTVALEDVITKQCTTMGCYFYFVSGERELRIDLQDVAMDAPKGRDGRRARVEGRTVPYDRGYQFMASAVEFQ